MTLDEAIAYMAVGVLAIALGGVHIGRRLGDWTALLHVADWSISASVGSIAVVAVVRGAGTVRSVVLITGTIEATSDDLDLATTTSTAGRHIAKHLGTAGTIAVGHAALIIASA